MEIKNENFRIEGIKIREMKNETGKMKVDEVDENR
jgi:hypothetical protein